MFLVIGLLLSACLPPQPQAVDPAEAQKMVFQAVTSSQSPKRPPRIPYWAARRVITGM